MQPLPGSIPKVERESARHAWRGLPKVVRRDVGRTAKKGLRWLLPLVGLALAVVDAFLLTPLLSLGGVIVLVYGLLGWSTTRVARSILDVADGLPTAPD